MEPARVAAAAGQRSEALEFRILRTFVNFQQNGLIIFSHSELLHAKRMHPFFPRGVFGAIVLWQNYFS
jgi:hypothetical protein